MKVAVWGVFGQVQADLGSENVENLSRKSRLERQSLMGMPPYGGYDERRAPQGFGAQTA